MPTPKQEGYQELAKLLLGLIADESDWLANTANFSALIFQHVYNLNWAGFYFLKEEELVLGPFQGKVACLRIPLGRGVCGRAAAKRETILVPDVHVFPGYITCDADTNSEIVIPLILNDHLIGVLDVDSPAFSRFDEEDKEGLESLVTILLDKTNFTTL